MKEKSFSIKEAFSFGWETTTKNLAFFAQIAFVFLAITFLVSIFSEATDEAGFFLLSMVIAVIGNIVSLLISLGFIRIALNFYDGKKSKIGDAFSQWNFLWHAILASVLFFLAVSLGFVLLIIPGVYLMSRLYFYDCFIIDKKENAVDSLRSSFRITKGNVLRIVLFLLAALVVNILGMLALVVGLLVTVPVTFLATVYVYRSLLGDDKKKGEEKEKEGDEKLEEKESLGEEKSEEESEEIEETEEKEEKS